MKFSILLLIFVYLPNLGKGTDFPRVSSGDSFQGKEGICYKLQSFVKTV
jgi:hypothetical protein